MSGRATGHLQVKGSRGQRAWYALWRDADGRHQRRLGPAHVKDSGRRTPRGAVVWRAGDGPKPGPDYLTPDDARAALDEVLAEAPVQSPAVGQRVTFGEACAEWLRYVEHDRQRSPATLQDYRNTAKSLLVPEFGAETMIDRIRTSDVDRFRERMLSEGRLSRRSAQKALVLLHGLFQRAARKGWVETNPVARAERITFVRSGDFTVLSPSEVEATARAARRPLDAAVIRVAAYSGLRLGELRALRWEDVDFERALIHVRRNYTHGGMGLPKSRRVRSVPMSDQVARTFDELSRVSRFTGPSDLVFANELGAPFDDARMRERFYRALEIAGLGHLRRKDHPIVFHDLRHTFGTLAVRSFPISDVKAMMGHADIQTTMIYVHHVPQHDAAAKLTKAFAAETAPAGIPTSARA